VEDVTKQITAAGSRAHAAVIDALDDGAVEEYIDGMVKQTGRIDIVFNAVRSLAKDYGNGQNALDLTTEQFMVPVNTVLKSQFISARAAAPHGETTFRGDCLPDRRSGGRKDGVNSEGDMVADTTAADGERVLTRRERDE
jgi:NAD(P)-dependent dehydrogenase (short-subunit alcohol dehydrogenase family)